MKSPEVKAYVDSILEFVGEEKRLVRLQQHRRSNGRFPTTEADILENHASDNGQLSEVEGLRLVLEACDELEAQVSHLLRDDEPTAADAS